MMVCPDCGGVVSLGAYSPKALEAHSPNDEDIYRCFVCGTVGEKRDLIEENEPDEL